jgi:hypothetical protein
MCVTQFKRACDASEFRHGEENRQRDMKDENLIVAKGTQWRNGRSWYYVTDKRKLKGLESYLNIHNYGK